jgi:hypothetical protein
VPQIRDYTQATSLQATDAFVIDRVGVGTEYIEASDFLNGTMAPLGQTCLTFIIDGAGSELTTGIAGDLEIPFACTITAATLLADQTGSVVVDVWKDTYANYPPTIADTITASAPPTISSGVKSQDTTLTGWTTSIAANSTLRFNVNSVTSITRLTVALTVQKVLA